MKASGVHAANSKGLCQLQGGRVNVVWAWTFALYFLLLFRSLSFSGIDILEGHKIPPSNLNSVLMKLFHSELISAADCHSNCLRLSPSGRLSRLQISTLPFFCMPSLCFYSFERRWLELSLVFQMRACLMDCSVSSIPCPIPFASYFHVWPLLLTGFHWCSGFFPWVVVVRFPLLCIPLHLNSLRFICPCTLLGLVSQMFIRLG